MITSEIELNLETREAGSVRVARWLLLLASVAAAGAVVTGVGSISNSGPDTLIVETWRVVGLGTFAGLFALLAYRPLHYAGVWELVILNKLALTVVSLTYGSAADGAQETAVVDGALTAVLVFAYILSKGWRAWQRGAR